MVSELLEEDTLCAAEDLQIVLLGECRLLAGQRPLPLSARKDLALLAFLANVPGEPQRRSRLASLLWSQSEDVRARESLKQSLLRLRKALPEGMLSTDRHSAKLLVGRHQVDVLRAIDLIATGTCESISVAAEMCFQVFLSGLEDISAEFEDWRNGRQLELSVSIKREALQALKLAVSCGNLSQAEELAAHVSRLDPLDEESIRYLISAYAADGRARYARRAFDELKNRLQLELGVEPERATRELMESLLPDNVPAVVDEHSSIPRVAVLMFTVGVDESSQKYFAEGLTDDITTDLARNKTLEVLPASSFAGLEGDLSRVLLARGATHVLHGSVRRADGRLRVNTRLVETRSNQIVWAQRYDRTMEGVFDMQDAISSQIVSGLRLELSTVSGAVTGHGTRDANAYRMFHKGRSLYLRGVNSHSLSAAKALLDRSIQIDPGFARAYAQLALGHAAVGLAYYASGQYQQAESALMSAIELDENLFEAQFFLARNRRLQGDHEGAAERFRLAVALRPDDFRSRGLLGDSLKASGFADEAEDVFKIAIERIEAVLEDHPDNADALAFGAPILADLGRCDQAREWSAWALAIEPDDCLSRYNLARMFSILDEPETALDHLEVAFDAPQLVQRRLALWMRHDGDFKRLETHLRFNGLLEFAEDSRVK